jgi:hypothetical protein
MLTVATLLWDPNGNELTSSRRYDETWVEKLYRGFERNLTIPFRFVVFVDRFRKFRQEGIDQQMLSTSMPTYANCIEPYKLNQPMILVGLDTIVTGNCDRMAEYCLHETMIALPRNPKKPEISCNGVALVPAGNRATFIEHHGENDMDWVCGRPHKLIDDLFPGWVLSYKAQVVKQGGLRDARIVYFHGEPKADNVTDPWIKRHWS